MWKCETCTKDIGDDLGLCWNCGTSKDGVPDPTFVHADPEFESKRTLGDLEEQVAEAFMCAKCAHDEAHIRRLTMSGPRYTVTHDSGPHFMIFVTCQACGFSEVYDAGVLGNHTALDTVLAALFG